MAYQFKTTESLGKGTRRIVRNRLKIILEQAAKPSLDPDAIHGIRKEIKKLRSLIRFARPSLGRKQTLRLRDQLRKAASLTGAIRDAEVQLHTVEEIFGIGTKPGTKPKSKFLDTYRKELEEEKRLFDARKTAANLTSQFDRMLRETGDWRFEFKNWNPVEKSIQKSYEKARELYQSFRKSLSPADLHAWRKSIKVLVHHLALVSGCWNSELKAGSAELETLEEMLGKQNDLELMLRKIAPQKNKSLVEKSTNKIRLRTETLRKTSLQMGRKIFSRSPADFCFPMEGSWERWRNAKA